MQTRGLPGWLGLAGVGGRCPQDCSLCGAQSSADVHDRHTHTNTSKMLFLRMNTCDIGEKSCAPSRCCWGPPLTQQTWAHWPTCPLQSQFRPRMEVESDQHCSPRQRSTTPTSWQTRCGGTSAGTAQYHSPPGGFRTQKKSCSL